MGSSSSCDSPDECVIRGCHFSKHSGSDINHGVPVKDANENTEFRSNVDSKLASFFNTNDAAKIKTINDLKTIITGKDTKDIDINAGCVSFVNATDPPGKKESFTQNTSTGQLIACTIIGIVFIVAAIFVWRWFICNRNEPSTVASTRRSIGTDKAFTIKRV